MRSSDKGFSIVEILIAMAVLSFGLLAVASMQVTSMKGNSFSRQTTEAMSLGQKHLDELLALPYNHPDLANGTHGSIIQQQRYQLDWNILEDNTLPQSKDIQVNVTWQSRNGDRQLTFSSLKADLI